MATEPVDTTQILRGLQAAVRALTSASGEALALTTALQYLAEATDGLRVSVVRIDDAHPEQGMVIASHDMTNADGIVIKLSQYPEIGEAVYSRASVVINRIEGSSLLEPVQSQVRQAGIGSLAIIPVTVGSPTVGTIVLRVARETQDFDEATTALCELFATVTGLAIERAALQFQPRTPPAPHDDSESLMIRLTEEIARATRHERPLSLLALYVAAETAPTDEVIRIVDQVIRPSDMVAQLDRGRYAIVLPEAEAEGAASKAEFIREQLATSLVPGLRLENDSVRIRIAAYGESDEETAVTFTARAMGQLDNT